MLDTVHAYALEKLTGADREETERRHTEWLLEMTDSFWHLDERGFPDALALFDLERANHRAAVQRSIDGGDARTVSILARNAFPFLMRRDALTETVEWLDQALHRAADASPAERGRLLLQRALLAGFLGDVAAVRPLLREAHQLLPPDLEGPQEHVMAGIAGVYAALAEGSVDEASRCIDEATEGFAAAGERIGAAVMQMIRGDHSLLLGDLDRAEQAYRTALDLAGRMADDGLAGEVLSQLGLVLLSRGDPHGARRSILDGAALNRRTGSPYAITRSLEGLAAVALAEGRPAVAARSLAAVQSAVRNTKTPLWPIFALLLDELTSRSRLELGEKAYAAACAEGGHEPLLKALDRALQDLAVDDPISGSR
jgi:tetratricopeptide (TPR) repeat protein